MTRKILPKATEVPTFSEYKQKINMEKFNEGYEYGLQHNAITKPEHLKYSFAMGFRKAKLEQREAQKKRGLHSFPFTRFKTSTKTESSSNIDSHSDSEKENIDL